MFIQKCSEADVIEMLEFLIDNIYVEFSEQSFRLAFQWAQTAPLTCRFISLRVRGGVYTSGLKSR